MTNSPSSPTTGFPSGVERRRIHAEAGRGHLTGVDRQQRAALHEARAHIRAPRAVVEVDVRANLPVQPLVALQRQRRAGGAEHADRRQVEACSRLEPLLAAGHRERGAETEERRPRLLRELPLEGQVGIGRVAVDHDDRGAREQHRDERVPHHPRGRREPLESVSGTEVPAKCVVLQMLDEDAAVAVHDRLRQPRRARREEHVQRVREGNGLELERPRLGQ